MDCNVDEMRKAYEEFTDSLTGYLLAVQISYGRDKALTDKALAKVKEHYATFKNACDNADGEIQIAKKRLLTEYGGSINESVLPSKGNVTIVDDDDDDDDIADTDTENLTAMYYSPPKDLLFDDRFMEGLLTDNISNGGLEIESPAAEKLADAAKAGPPGETAGSSCSVENAGEEDVKDSSE